MSAATDAHLESRLFTLAEVVRMLDVVAQNLCPCGGGDGVDPPCPYCEFYHAVRDMAEES